MPCSIMLRRDSELARLEEAVLCSCGKRSVLRWNYIAGDIPKRNFTIL